MDWFQVGYRTAFIGLMLYLMGAFDTPTTLPGVDQLIAVGVLWYLMDSIGRRK